MVSDAEAHAEEDKKFRELVGARNKADATVHAVEKALVDAGDKVSEDEKKSANDAIAAVKAAMASDDREDLERKTQALEQASTALMQKMYEHQQAAGGQGPGVPREARAATRAATGRRARRRVRRGQGKRPQEGLRDRRGSRDDETNEPPV